MCTKEIKRLLFHIHRLHGCIEFRRVIVSVKRSSRFHFPFTLRFTFSNLAEAFLQAFFCFILESKQLF